MIRLAGMVVIVSTPSTEICSELMIGCVERMVALTNASGIHVRSISQWCLGTLLTVYHKLDKQIIHSKVRLVSPPFFPFYSSSMCYRR